jgi:drug/metabolite transporter (DMT)-like permease
VLILPSIARFGERAYNVAQKNNFTQPILIARVPHRFAGLDQALHKPYLWSTSWVLIKIGLVDIPALTFAGLRYGLAFLCLLPFFWRSPGWSEVRHLSPATWLHMVVLGLIYYGLTQGAQFVGLVYLPALLGRFLNRLGQIRPLTVTTISMGVGAAVLLTVGLLTQGLPSLNGQSWIIIIWLAVVNTAFAFTLWNITLRTLSAMESSIINNTMEVQIPILAVIFLNEVLTGREVFGMVVAITGVLVVQLGRSSTSSFSG